jgi:hypothetical protein
MIHNNSGITNKKSQDYWPKDICLPGNRKVEVRKYGQTEIGYD